MLDALGPAVGDGLGDVSSGVARARWAMAWRVERRAVSLNPVVPAAWAASWVISWMPVVWRSRHWPCCLRRKPAFCPQYRHVPIRVPLSLDWLWLKAQFGRDLLQFFFQVFGKITFKEAFDELLAVMPSRTGKLLV